MRRLVPAVLAVAVLASVAGCRSGTAPDDWAGQVCAALTPWRASIAELNTRTQQQITETSTPTDTRDRLLELLAGGETASENARAAVAAAGTPDVDGGAEVAARFVASLQQARDAYAHARADLRALSPNDAPDFYGQVLRVMTTLNAEYARSGLDTSTLDSVELRTAFDRVDRCR